ncbi:MAG: hypothetical protein WAV32_09995 [Halobacteriota archaeon]
MRSAINASASLSVVVLFIFALSCAAIPAAFVHVTATQSSGKVSISSTTEWKDSQKESKKVLDEVKKKELIFDDDYEIINASLTNADSAESFICLVDNLTVEINRDNKLTPFAPFLKIATQMFGNERINMYITRRDNSTFSYSVVMKDGKAATVRKDVNTNPTINVYTNENTLRDIMDSPDPFTAFQTAWKSGEIECNAVGPITGLKIAAAGRLLDVYYLQPLPFITLPDFYYKT